MQFHWMKTSLFLSFVSFTVLPVLVFAAAVAKTAPTTAPQASKLEAIAQVIWVKGSVQAIQPGAKERTLQRRSVIYPHDLLTTTAGSTGEIAFTDSSVMSLAANSQVKIDSYSYHKASTDNASFGLVKGGFRTITGAIPKENPDSYQVNTPVATIGVRGTQFTSLLTKTKGLLLKIEKGKILVKNGAGYLELQKCDAGDKSSKCKVYAQILSANAAPISLETAPVELTTDQPLLTPLPAGLTAPGGVNTNTPGKTNSFCIG